MGDGKLYLTLGHNASALFTHPDLKKPIGYEQERLDRIKGSSYAPTDALLEIIKHVGLDMVMESELMISHWFDRDHPHNYGKNKYFDLNLSRLLDQLETNYDEDLHESKTHHDAHADSALSFFLENVTSSQLDEMVGKLHIIVADGFGQKQEVVTVYEYDPNVMTKRTISKEFGYNKSLGLMYQYATAFVGMSENKDEYKFLGYESMVNNFLSETGLETIYREVKDVFIPALYENQDVIDASSSKNFINLYQLDSVRHAWYKRFSTLLKKLDIQDDQSVNARVAVGFAIQNAVETYIIGLLKSHEMRNVLVTGGVFYNVKLNNTILKNTEGLFCAQPIAGDQGAAVGMYSQDFKWDNLCYGNRSLKGIEKFKGVEVVEDIETMSEKLVSYLEDEQIVNIVRDEMEFGPRALCHTSTIMIPQQHFVDENNRMNNRNEVMPCAPVIKEADADFFFDSDQVRRVVGSDSFMILTYHYSDPKTLLSTYEGVMHNHPVQEGEFTGRPQFVANDSLIGKTLDGLGISALVNTSFNAHGQPICFDTDSIIQNYYYQRERAGKDRLKLLVLKNGNK